MTRRIVFWTHLALGLTAGLFIFSMSVTGVLLTYERQIVRWAEDTAVERPADGERLDADALILAARRAGAEPGHSIVIASNDTSVTTLSKGRRERVLLNPYSGEVLPDASEGIRAFFSRVTAIHRWLAVTGERNDVAMAANRASNLVFAALLLTGAYLWLPRIWKWAALKQQILFNTAPPSAKARYYNWHHVLAIWSFLPLIAIVISGAVFSYPWANSLVYAVYGEESPARRGAPPNGRINPASSDAASAEAEVVSYEHILQGAVDQVHGWQRATITLPEPGASMVSISVDRGNGAQASKVTRFSAPLDGAGPPQPDPPETTSPASGARRFLRFLHTGEIYGWWGQTIAGLASLAGAVLVYSGMWLGIGRLARMRRAARTSTVRGD